MKTEETQEQKELRMLLEETSDIGDVLGKEVIEVAEGCTIEPLEPLYVQDGLLIPPTQLYCADIKGSRYYYKYTDKGLVGKTSISTIINRTCPTEQSLIDWYAKNGLHYCKSYLYERQMYGTFLHGECAVLIQNKRYNLDDLPNRLKKYIERNRLSNEFMNNKEDLIKDILGFNQFIIEKKAQFYAVEIALESKLGFACRLDFPCSIEVEEKVNGFHGEVYQRNSGKNKKGEPRKMDKIIKKRINALIDLKSSRKGVYKSSRIQLEGQRIAWEENFPNIKINKIYNLRPTDWIGKEPKYTLTDQTGKIDLKMFKYYLSIDKLINKSMEKKVYSYRGVIEAGKNMKDNIIETSINDAVKKAIIKHGNGK